MNGKRAKTLRKLSRLVMTDAVVTSKFEEMKKVNDDYNAKLASDPTMQGKFKPRPDIVLDIVATRRKFYKAMKKQYIRDFVAA